MKLHCFRPISIITAISVLLLMPIPAIGSAQAGDFLPGELVVGMRYKPATSNPSELFPWLGIEEITDIFAPYESRGIFSRSVYHIVLLDKTAQSVLDAVASLEGRMGVAYAVPNAVGKPDLAESYYPREIMRGELLVGMKYMQTTDNPKGLFPELDIERISDIYEKYKGTGLFNRMILPQTP